MNYMHPQALEQLAEQKRQELLREAEEHRLFRRVKQPKLLRERLQQLSQLAVQLRAQLRLERPVL